MGAGGQVVPGVDREVHPNQNPLLVAQQVAEDRGAAVVVDHPQLHPEQHGGDLRPAVAVRGVPCAAGRDPVGEPLRVRRLRFRPGRVGYPKDVVRRRIDLVIAPEHARHGQPHQPDRHQIMGAQFVHGDWPEPVPQFGGDPVVGDERVDRGGHLPRRHGHQRLEEAVPAALGRHRDQPEVRQPIQLLLRGQERPRRVVRVALATSPVPRPRRDHGRREGSGGPGVGRARLLQRGRDCPLQLQILPVGLGFAGPPVVVGEPAGPALDVQVGNGVGGRGHQIRGRCAGHPVRVGPRRRRRHRGERGDEIGAEIASGIGGVVLAGVVVAGVVAVQGPGAGAGVVGGADRGRTSVGGVSGGGGQHSSVGGLPDVGW